MHGQLKNDALLLVFSSGESRQMEATLVLTFIAQRFSLSLEPGQSVVPEPKMTLRPRNGIRMRVFRRSQE